MQMKSPRAESRWAAAAALLLTASLPLPAQPVPGPESLIAQAREAARTDRNAESVRLFREAIAADPSRRAGLLRELADQMTYSGESKAAIPLYREVLARPGLSKEDERRALSGLALALSWNESLDEALRIYERLVAEDPGSFEARRNAARVLSWRGRHRAARRRLAALLAERPDDAETAVLLAQAERWSGRPDLATATLRSLLARQRDHREAASLLKELDRQTRPQSTAGGNVSNQSDGLGIVTAWLEHEATDGLGLSEFGARLEHIRYRPDPGQGDEIRIWRPGLHGRHRFGDDWEGNAWVFVDFIRPAGTEPPRDVLTFDTWATYWPGDVVRFDVGLNRTTFDNEKSQLLGIAALTGSLSVDVTPNERLVLKARVDYGDYTDGNRRTGWVAGGSFRILHSPRLLVGVRYTGFSFSEQLDNGYFNPERYQSIVATVHAWGPIGPRLSWDVEGNAGEEFVVPDGDKPTWGIGGKLTWQISENVEVKAWGGHFDSRLASSAGFARTWGGLSIGARW